MILPHSANSANFYDLLYPSLISKFADISDTLRMVYIQIFPLGGIMKIVGTFVGINKYLSPNAPELSSAVRDAKSLWALFTDTFSDMQSDLLLDENATCESIKASITKLLGEAGPDDIAIFSFSGHGSRSHRIVAHDTVSEKVDTTIPMEFLAEKFKASKAKVIICILDCCFSGGATAKVFADTPATRDFSDPYEQLTGKGRILIAAANAAQPAYERPGVGHGLLTEAVIRILKSGEAETIDVTAAIYQIMEIVQAEAGRLGVIQTPVIVSLIEGGLTFPALREGEKYQSFFPTERGQVVSRAITDLSAFNFPEQVLTEWCSRYPAGLNTLQIKAVNDYKILAGDSLLVVAPTSSGKTFVGELASVRAITSGRKAVFLLPYRALVNEKYDQFKKSYSDTLGYRIVRCSGDYSDQASDFMKGKYDLAILTFEMFLNLIVSYPNILNQLGLVVLDEAQFVTDPNRGINIELLLTCLITARNRGVNPQIIALSAVIDDVNKFDAWLGLNLIQTRDRPVPLSEGVIDRTGRFQYLDNDGNVKEEQIIPSHEIRMRGKDPSAQDVIVPLAKKLIAAGEKILVFRNIRGKAQGCANYLANDLGLSPATEALNKLPHLDQSATSQALRRCLNGGTAFHTSNLSREEREVVEVAFKEKEGPVRALAATTTVAAGINTPASTVIIAEQEFIGEDGRAFTVSEYKNMAGRAGRLGFQETGKSMIYAETPTQRAQLFQKYVLGKVENMTSSFHPKELNTWVVRLLAQVKNIPKSDITSLLANTYGGYQATCADGSWPKKMETLVNTLLGRMLSLGLLEEEGDNVQLSLLGRACGNSSLSFESSLRLVELVRGYSSSRLDGLMLLALVQILQECDDTYTPLFKKGSGETKRIQDATDRFGRSIVQGLQKFAGSAQAYQARCKRAAILYDWVTGVPIDKIEQTYSYTPYSGAVHSGDIRRIADNTRFHLRSAFQIALVITPQNLCGEDDFDRLLKQLEVGLPADSVKLLEIPLSLTRGEYLSLRQNGIHSPSHLWENSSQQINDLLGNVRADQLELVRP